MAALYLVGTTRKYYVGKYLCHFLYPHFHRLKTTEHSDKHECFWLYAFSLLLDELWSIISKKVTRYYMNFHVNRHPFMYMYNEEHIPDRKCRKVHSTVMGVLYCIHTPCLNLYCTNYTIVVFVCVWLKVHKNTKFLFFKTHLGQLFFNC